MNVTRRSFLTLASLAMVSSPFALAGCSEKGAAAKAWDKAPTENTIELHTDVIVIGAGGAGMTAALSAATSGAESITVFEKALFMGGNTAYSEGLLTVGELPEDIKADSTPELDKVVAQFIEKGPQSEEESEHWGQLLMQYETWKTNGSHKVFDSNLFTEMQYARSDEAPLAWYLGVYQRASDYLNWFMETTGAPFAQAIGTFGYTYPRFTHVAGYENNGRGYFDYMQKAIGEQGYAIDVYTSTPAESLILDEEGNVTGAIARDSNNITYVAHASKGVIVASGGYSANAKMMQQYNTQWSASYMEHLRTDNPPCNNGDGITMAQTAGASLADMENQQLLADCSALDGSFLSFVGNLELFMCVNQEGRRFIDETGGRPAMAQSIIDQTNSVAYIISDSLNCGIVHGKTARGKDVEHLISKGALYRADSLEELAQQFGANPDTFIGTIASFNEACISGIDQELGRVQLNTSCAIAEGPFYAYPIAPAAHITFGGINVDEHFQVLDEKGASMKGLYAVGEVANGQGGIDFALPAGYLAGLHVMHP